MKKLILLFLLIFCNSFAQNSKELFDNANALYKNGKHKEAIKLYENITSKKLVSSELYFNLANCYYKLNNVAPAIYNYEKALQINPANQDAQNNLIFAKRLTLDRIEELPKTFLQNLNQNYISRLSVKSWAFISILSSVLTALFFLLYYYNNSSFIKRLYFIFSLFSIVTLFSSLFIAFHQHTKETNTIEAIVYTEEVSVKNEPTKNASESFIIHEGTKVYVLDAVDNWNKIKLVDGKTGWLKKTSINLLNHF